MNTEQARVTTAQTQALRAMSTFLLGNVSYLGSCEAEQHSCTLTLLWLRPHSSMHRKGGAWTGQHPLATSDLGPRFSGWSSHPEEVATHSIRGNQVPTPWGNALLRSHARQLSKAWGPALCSISGALALEMAQVRPLHTCCWEPGGMTLSVRCSPSNTPLIPTSLGV